MERNQQINFFFFKCKIVGRYIGQSWHTELRYGPLLLHCFLRKIYSGETYIISRMQSWMIRLYVMYFIYVGAPWGDARGQNAEKTCYTERYIYKKKRVERSRSMRMWKEKARNRHSRNEVMPEANAHSGPLSHLVRYKEAWRIFDGLWPYISNEKYLEFLWNVKRTVTTVCMENFVIAKYRYIYPVIGLRITRLVLLSTRCQEPEVEKRYFISIWRMWTEEDSWKYYSFNKGIHIYDCFIKCLP